MTKSAVSVSPQKIPLIPPRLWQNLQHLAEKYQVMGVDLFIFGSYAKGTQRPVSDLDLGVEWQAERDAKVFSNLYWDIQDLPTIRKIDLVDFSQCDAEFKQMTSMDKIYLTER